MYGSINLPLKLCRTIVIGKNKTLVKQLLLLLTYFIRCSDVTETEMEIHSNGRELFTLDTLSQTDTPSSVESWVENSKQVITPTEDIKLQTIEFKNDISCEAMNPDLCKEIHCEKNVGGTPKYDIETEDCCRNVCDEDSYNSLEICRTSTCDSGVSYNTVENCYRETGDCLNFSDMPSEIDVSQCYCSVLQKLDSVSIRNLTKYLSKSDIKKISLERLMTKAITKVGKSCFGCGTLEKLICDVFCEQCKNGDFSLQVERTCRICFKNSRKMSKCDSRDMKRSTFICYCCPSKNDNDGAIDCENMYRPRKFSDPIPCISPKTRSLSLHAGTKSNDSGTEMNSSISGDSTMLVRLDSLSSQASSAAVDSDYCSIGNDDINEPKELLCKVRKSTSTTTLKNLNAECSYFEQSFNESIKEQPMSSLLTDDLKNMHLTQVPLLGSVVKAVETPSNDVRSTFGRSLFAGYCEKYSANFVLQGVPSIDQERLVMDMKNTVQYSVVDEEIVDAMCIVADTDNWTCELWNLSKRTDSFSLRTSESLNRKPVFASHLVSSLVESTKDLAELRISPAFCLLHVEEQLKDIYNRGRVITEMASISKAAMSRFTQKSGYHSTDVDLLTAVGNAYSSQDYDLNVL